MKFRKAAELCLSLTASAAPILMAQPAEAAGNRQFMIDQQPLDDALREFGLQAEHSIVYPHNGVQGRNSPGVKGDLPEEEALQRLLKGTGMKASRTARGTFVIKVAQLEASPFPPGATVASPRSEPVPEPVVPARADAAADGEIIVTAQRRAERLRDVPISIVARTGADLTAAGITGSRELVQIVPGLTLSGFGAYIQPAIRGVSSTSATPGNDANVGVYLDGIYQPFQAGNAFELADISRIEVAKGPQGTLFGRNATGGAIQVFTLNPSFTPTGSITVSAGRYSVKNANEGEVKGFISGALSEKIAASFSGLYRIGNGYIVNLYDNNRLDYSSVMARTKLLFEPSDDLSFILTGYYSHRDDPSTIGFQPIKGNTLGKQIDPTIVSPTDPYKINVNYGPVLKIESYGASLKGEWSLPEMTITSLTGYAHNETTNFTDADGSTASVLHYVNPVFGHTFSQELTFSSASSNQFHWVGGLFYYYDYSAFEPLTVENVVSLIGLVKTHAYAAFGELTYEILPRLTVIGGVRYSSERKRYEGSLVPAPPSKIAAKTFSDVTPRASVRYALSDYANIYFTFSQGFKSGQFNSASFSPVPIEPEKITAYEGGFKFGRGVNTLNVSAYYYDYTNLQVETLNFAGSVTENAANARLYGLDVDGSFGLTDGLVVRGGVSYQPEANYVRYRNASANIPNPAGGNDTGSIPIADGIRLIRAPKLTANIAVNFDQDFEDGRLSLSTSVYYTSKFKYEITGRVAQPRYANVNAAISWIFPGDHWRVGIFGRNLTDLHHIQKSSALGPGGDNVNYQAPRIVGLTAGYKF